MTEVNQMNASSTEVWTQQELSLLSKVEQCLVDGIVLKDWWERTYPINGFQKRFELERMFNRPDSSFGFFDQVELPSGPLPVMGNFQMMFYDQPRAPNRQFKEAAEWMREQIQEFVLHYFMRVSDFRQPEAYVAPEMVATTGWLERLSWCPQSRIDREGFGFRQQYYKLRSTGEIGKFPQQSETAIVDLRELGEKYAWIVVKVRIFDFNLGFRPFASDGPTISIPLNEQSYLVLSSAFITNQDHPAPDCLGRYGIGYSFIHNSTEGLIVYGPGEFRAAIELIDFEVSEGGQVHVKLTFVADRPERITNVSLNPVNLSFGLADLFSFGMTSEVLAPLKNALQTIPQTTNSFDPVYGFVSLANALTANQAAQQLCISREQLEKIFLLQHFMQHYVTMVGSLLTWRQIPDWLDCGALPDWVVTGSSS